MILHRKCAIYLLIVCMVSSVTRCSGSNIKSNDINDSDDDERLKQALILVDLLKKEYVRALRENHDLRKKEGSLMVESTCDPSDAPSTSKPSIAAAGPTTQKPAPILSSEQRPWRRMAGMTTNSLQDFLGRNDGFQPYKFMRRRMPMDYYYDYPVRRRVPFRRNDEGDPSTVAAPETSTTLTSAAKESTIPTETATDISPSVTTVVTAANDVTSADGITTTDTVTSADEYNTADGVTFTDVDTATDGITTTDAVTSAEEVNTADGVTSADAITSTVYVTSTEGVPENIESTTDKTTDNILTNATLKTTEVDLVSSQVASELVNEMRSGSIKTTKRKPRTRTSKYVALSNKFILQVKPTMKIHLSGSTRIPIPLPKNHAFCYTNPRNALCRSPI